MRPEELSHGDEAALRRAYTDLRTLADHPVPAVRGPVRLALAEVAQVMNSLGIAYDLYSDDLAP